MMIELWHAFLAILDDSAYLILIGFGLAGLLHDSGQLIMEAAYPDKYATALARLDDDEK